jgi:Zn-dependent protease
VDSLAEGLTAFVVFLFSTTLHEAAHAWAALRGGDPTAYRGGQVSLDPRPHIRREPLGLVVLPIITALVSGWPMGFASAPYDPQWAQRHPTRAALMSLAGPAANLALVCRCRRSTGAARCRSCSSPRRPAPTRSSCGARRGSACWGSW